MNELNQIIAAYDHAQKNDEACVMATVTFVDGSSYRRPGARMLMTEAGSLVGCVSGGCLERDLVRKAGFVLQKKEAMLVAYDTRDDREGDTGVDTEIKTKSIGAGLGCNGWIEILLEPIFAGSPHLVLEKLKAWTQQGCEGWFTLSPHVKNPNPKFFSEPHSVEAMSALSDLAKTQSAKVYLEKFLPAVSLTLIGAGYDAVALSGLAVKMGHDVRIVDFRSSLPIPRRAFEGVQEYIQCEPEALDQKIHFNERSAVIVMTHQADDDLAALPSILRAKPAYVGILGPKIRGERLLAEMKGKGISISEDMLKRIYFPVGLDIGAETPAEIALSILAEISAVLNHRKGGLLRERQGPIHLRSLSP